MVDLRVVACNYLNAKEIFSIFRVVKGVRFLKTLAWQSASKVRLRFQLNTPHSPLMETTIKSEMQVRVVISAGINCSWRVMEYLSLLVVENTHVKMFGQIQMTDVLSVYFNV